MSHKRFIRPGVTVLFYAAIVACAVWMIPGTATAG
jgi:hypothetical protein